MEDIIEKESEDRETNHMAESKGQKKKFGIAIESPRGEIKQEKEFGPTKFTFEDNKSGGSVDEKLATVKEDRDEHKNSAVSRSPNTMNPMINEFSMKEVEVEETDDMHEHKLPDLA